MKYENVVPSHQLQVETRTRDTLYPTVALHQAGTRPITSGTQGVTTFQLRKRNGLHLRGTARSFAGIPGTSTPRVPHWLGTQCTGTASERDANLQSTFTNEQPKMPSAASTPTRCRCLSSTGEGLVSEGEGRSPGP